MKASSKYDGKTAGQIGDRKWVVEQRVIYN